MRNVFRAGSELPQQDYEDDSTAIEMFGMCGAVNLCGVGFQRHDTRRRGLSRHAAIIFSAVMGHSPETARSQGGLHSKFIFRRSSVRPFLIGLSILLVVVLGDGPCSAQKPSIVLDKVKLPVPRAADRQESEAHVIDLFELDKEKSLQENRVLSDQLLESGLETRDDPPMRFVLLDMSRKKAAAAGDIAASIRVIDQLATDFAIDEAAARADSIHLASDVSGLAREQQRAIGKAGIDLIHQLLESREFAKAEAMLKMMSGIARKSRDAELFASLKRLQARVDVSADSYTVVQAAMKKLEANPDDSAASTIVGCFYFFEQEDWESAFPLLAKCDDDPLSSLARMELANPTSVEQQIKLADAWWDAGKKGEDPFRSKKMLLRAGKWYQQVEPHLSGLTKRKAVVRRRSIGAADSGMPRSDAGGRESQNIRIVSPAPGTVSMLEDGIHDTRWAGPQSMDLLPWVQLPRDQLTGHWKIGDGVIESGSERNAYLRLPVIPPEEYELTLQITPSGSEQPASPVFEIITNAPTGHRFTVTLQQRIGGSNDRRFVSGIGAIRGALIHSEHNESRIDGKFFKYGKQNRIVLTVLKTGIRVEVNGQEVVHWAGEFKDLKSQRTFLDPTDTTLLLGANQDPILVHSAVLKRLVTKPPPFVVDSAQPTHVTGTSWFRRQLPDIPVQLQHRQSVRLSELPKRSMACNRLSISPEDKRYARILPDQPLLDTHNKVVMHVHRRGRTTYALHRRYRKFSAEVYPSKVTFGGNDLTDPVTFEVHGDGNLLAKIDLQAPYGDAQQLSADVTDVDTLTLIVRCDGRGAFASAYWLNPILEK
jgi:hypothetical protein